MRDGVCRRCGCMLVVFCTGGAWVKINWRMCLVVCMYRRVIGKTKTCLSGPSSLTIMGSPQVIGELGLKSIKSKLNLMEILDPQMLSIKHQFYIIHAMSTLPTVVSNKSTSST